MAAAYGAAAVAAVLLVAAGLAKVVSPAPAVAAMRALGLPTSPTAVRVGAWLECVIGAWALAVGSAWSLALVAASYAAFAVFLVVATQSAAIADCGCFGSTGSPPRLRQVVLDVMLAAAAVLSLAGPVQPVPSLVTRSPLVGAVFVICTVAAASLAYLVHEAPVDEAGRS